MSEPAEEHPIREKFEAVLKKAVALDGDDPCDFHDYWDTVIDELVAALDGSEPAEESEVTIASIKSIDEAMAENAANRGPANRYRAMGVAGLCGEMDAETGDIVEMEEEEATWCVVSEAHTALDVMNGDAAVFAICETLADAETVADALNKHFAN